jgi:Xaa-Pro aminopeptidase
MTEGDRFEERVTRWAAKIDDLMRQHGRGNRRIASDRMELWGHHALVDLGLSVVDAGPSTEIARSIKSPHEIT